MPHTRHATAGLTTSRRNDDGTNIHTRSHDSCRGQGRQGLRTERRELDAPRQPGERLDPLSAVSVLSLAIWSRDWIGIWCLVPVALGIAWLFVNPLLFRAPRSNRNWASRSVLGERIWIDRKNIELPDQFQSRAPFVANAYSTIGLALLAYGLVKLDVVATVAGILITHGG